MDIESLYKAVPQLAKVFRIIDKIGEGKRSHNCVHDLEFIVFSEEKLFVTRIIQKFVYLVVFTGACV